MHAFRSFDNTLIHCWSVVPDSGPPNAKIILVHGFGTHSEALHFLYLRDYLIGKRFAVYGLDLRGFGRSGGRRAYVRRWQDFRRDLALFVQAVEQDGPASPLFVLGVSLGGLIVVNYALHHPEGIQGVIAMSPAFDVSRVPAWRRMLLRMLAHISPRLALKTGLDVSRLARDEEAQREFLSDPFWQTRMTLRLASQSMAAMVETAELLPYLGLPLLVLHGSADVIIPPEGGRRLCELAGSTDKEFRLIDGGFHILNLEPKREEVFDYIGGWIASRLDAGEAIA
jgi:acylglycerol lipase